MKRTGEEIIETHGGRILRSSNRKDTHSKVQTSRGSRERRVRLAADTAIQFYDVQDRLGYDRPSKAVDWLIQKAKAAIDNLAEPPPTGVLIEPNSPPPPLVDENHTKLSAFEPQNFTSFPAHFMHSNELCLSLQSLEENLSSQISSTYDRNPISSGSCTTNFEETNYPRPMSWNGDVAGNYRAVRSRSFEYDFNLQQHSVYSNSGTGEPVKSSHVLLPDFHTWDHEQQQQLRSTISGTHFTPRGLSWGSGLKDSLP